MVVNVISYGWVVCEHKSASVSGMREVKLRRVAIMLMVFDEAAIPRARKLYTLSKIKKCGIVCVATLLQCLVSK